MEGRAGAADRNAISPRFAGTAPGGRFPRYQACDTARRDDEP